MKFFFTLIFLLSVLSFKTGYCQNYNKIMYKAVKKAIGHDLKGYQIRSYPIDNMGLITSYNNTQDDFICDMWACIGRAAPPSGTEEWIKMDNFAGEGSGGSITLSESKRKKVAINFALPKIYNALGIEADFKSIKKRDVSLFVSRAHIRYLRKDTMELYIQKLPVNSNLRKAYEAGNLVMVVRDCILDDLEVTVKVDDSTATKLDAKMKAMEGTVAANVLSEGNLSIQIEKGVTGTYVFKVKHPVVFATLTKKQPGAGLLGVKDDYLDWNEIPLRPDPSVLK